ncbi:aspartate aminotransferase family protein [Subtercola sp. RTI3]|uniref:aspartate aminotransferase family protein n=1 Tax=Subtercola sp. RTI3 TaxID=3048639 RepID=UPI002B22EF52|nr:aspartate aminotransferase family protein [Subtercola sp. RTI3]MEA9986629.1 aspartate aminotransferase family protein [Subtercola sp. RTI3]
MPPAQSESDTNTGLLRRDWSDRRAPDDRALLERDSAVYLHQAVSTPCLTSIAGAEGVHLIATDGRRYLDFHGNSAHQIGYGHPRLVSALTKQLVDLPFVPRRFTSPVSTAFAEKLVEVTPEPLTRVLLTTGGSDAVEVALKLARAKTGRFKTLSFWESFHGAGFGAASVGGEQLFRSGPIGPLLSGTEHVPPIGCFRAAFGASHRFDEPHTPDCGRELARLIDYTLRVQGDVAAVIAEPMRATPEMAAPGFWASIRRSCDETGTVLIFDEIPTGLGRTGRMFASEHEAVVPDILVLGKGLGGAAMPVAAVVAREEFDVGESWAFGHYTHEKNPLMARAGLTTLQIIEDEGLVERSARLGEHALERARGLAATYDVIGDVRGRGLMLALEIVDPSDPSAPAGPSGPSAPASPSGPSDSAGPSGPSDFGNRPRPAPAVAEAVMYAALERGLSFKTTMGSILTLAPPLIITLDQLDEAFDVLDASFEEVLG